MRRMGLAFLLSFSLLAPISSADAVAPKEGAKCKKVGATQISKGLRFTCIWKNKKLVWNSGVRVKRVAPSTTTKPSQMPSVTASPSATPTTIPSPTLSGSTTPTASPSPTLSPNATPTVSPTAATSPSSSSTSASANPVPAQQRFIPDLKLLGFDSKICKIEISNYDPSFQWSFSAPIGTISQFDNFLVLENQSEFSGTTIKVVTRKSGFDVGEASINCTR